jgi:hypothetical protein
MDATLVVHVLDLHNRLVGWGLQHATIAAAARMVLVNEAAHAVDAGRLDESPDRRAVRRARGHGSAVAQRLRVRRRGGDGFERHGGAMMVILTIVVWSSALVGTCAQQLAGI